MAYMVKASTDGIIVEAVRDFEPKHIFECGQCFRWDRESDGSYTGVVNKRVINIAKSNDAIIMRNTNPEEFKKFWYQYFDLSTDYSLIKEELSRQDEVMRTATGFGHGIRILQQEPWETIASFIISANNNIPRIKKAILLMSERYGEYIGTFNNAKYYAFPSPEALMDLTERDLTECNLGYRAPYMIETARAVALNSDILEELFLCDSRECHKRLLQLKGVGPKVANCIAFFSFGKLDAFPVDVWIKRLMEHFYFFKETPSKEIEDFAHERYKDLAGYAQQYLFYYGRELEIGKGDKNARNDS